MNRKHLLLFSAAYSLLFFLLFPGYRYVMDPDATGYLAVAEHLAKGDMHESINGIWSPFNSWILVPFLKAGYDGILVAKYLNGLFGLISLTAFFSLLKKMQISFFYEMAILSSAVLLILLFVFNRVFGDLLQTMFLLLYLNVILSKNFGRDYRSILLAAFMGGIGFYAKAYIFFFTLLHLPIAIYLAERINAKINIKTLIKKISLAVLVLLFTASAWFIILQNKYGHYIPGEKQITGTLSQQYDQPRVLIYPPPYPGSYSVFDDISYFNFKTITPFTNFHLFIAQCKLIGYNFIAWLQRLNEFSFACIIIIITGFWLLFFRRTTAGNGNLILLLSFIIAWSAGFLFFHVETRFLWIIDLCLLIMAGIILSNYWNNNNKRQKLIAGIIIISSFCIFPAVGLKNMYGTGKDNFAIADALRKNGIRGNILTSYQNSGEFSQSIIINYLSKNRHYGPYVTDYTVEEILDAIKIHDINYFLFYYSTPFQKQDLLNGELAVHASDVYQDLYPGIIVLSFKK